MKIVADQNIPCVADAFADLGEVHLLPGREINRADLVDCRCLIPRTVTRVDAALLRDTPVEFVGTATIGTDHIDLDYLGDAGIACSNAAGCNAEAAAEYVVSGLFALSARRGFDPFALRAGIVGYGNVGSRLQQKLAILGIDHLVCDPPLAESGDDRQTYVDLDTIIRECNFISLHVPLTRDGAHPTFHLLGRAQLQKLGDSCLLVNAARGEVVDNAALLELLAQRGDLMVYLDTWEGEPLVNRELMRRIDLATPHIAGYSVEGRLRGTQMVLDAACRHFGQASRWHMSQQLGQSKIINLGETVTELDSWQKLFTAHCDIWRDHDAFVEGATLDDAALSIHFDGLRRVYADRREYEYCRVGINGKTPAPSLLQRLGFGIGD